MLLWSHRMEQQRARPKYEVKGIRVGWSFTLTAGALDIGKRDIQTLADMHDDGFLTSTEVSQFLINRSAQRCAPVSAEISCALTRNKSSSLRTLPSST